MLWVNSFFSLDKITKMVLKIFSLFRVSGAVEEQAASKNNDIIQLTPGFTKV